MQGRSDLATRAVRQLSGDEVSALAINGSCHVTASALADYRVAFPIAQPLTLIDKLGAFVDTDIPGICPRLDGFP